MTGIADDSWVLEWHQESNSIHIQPVSRMLGLNGVRFVINAPSPNRYIPIFIGTKQQVKREADRIRPTLINREKERVTL